MAAICTASGNNAEDVNYQVTVMTLIIERSYAITIFIEVAVKLLGQRIQAEKQDYPQHPRKQGGPLDHCDLTVQGYCIVIAISIATCTHAEIFNTEAGRTNIVVIKLLG